MHWSWQDFESLPLSVYDVLIAHLQDEQRDRLPGGRLWQS